MTLGDAAEVAAAHSLNEWILDPAVCSQTEGVSELKNK